MAVLAEMLKRSMLFENGSTDAMASDDPFTICVASAKNSAGSNPEFKMTIGILFFAPSAGVLRGVNCAPFVSAN